MDAYAPTNSYPHTNPDTHTNSDTNSGADANPDSGAYSNASARPVSQCTNWTNGHGVQQRKRLPDLECTRIQRH